MDLIATTKQYWGTYCTERPHFSGPGAFNPAILVEKYKITTMFACCKGHHRTQNSTLYCVLETGTFLFMISDQIGLTFSPFGPESPFNPGKPGGPYKKKNDKR